MADSQLFEDTFEITGKVDNKYDRVSRVSGISTSHDGTEFSLDVNHELYPLNQHETVQLMLASTLNLDGTKDEKGWRELDSNETTLADMYDYVCHGKVYRFEEGDGDKIGVYVSFGGLLLYISGPYKKLTPLRIDYVYLLLKK